MAADESSQELSPLAQKLAMQEGWWKPPDYLDTNASYLGEGNSVPFLHATDVPPPGYQQTQGQYWDSNSASSWSYDNSYNTSAYQSTRNNNSDPSYDAKVESFLKACQQ